MNKSLRNISIILINTLVLLLVIEVSVRIFRNQTEETVIVSGHKKVVHLDSSNYTLSYVPGVEYYHRKPEFYNRYNINAEGMREDKTYLDKPRGTTKIRILAIGDSFTYGQGNDLEDVWHSVLERSVKIKNKGIEIINAGVGAHDQYQEYYHLQKIIGLYKPDYVLLGFLPNDLTSNKHVNRKIWPSNVKPIEEPVKPYVALMNNYQTLALARRILLLNKSVARKRSAHLDYFNFFKKPEDQSPEISKQFEVTGVLFSQIDSICKGNNAALIVAFIPHIYEVISDERTDIDLFAIEKFIEEQARKNNFYFIPSLQYLRKITSSGVQTYYYEDEHLTPAGNKVLADALKVDLVKILENQN